MRKEIIALFFLPFLFFSLAFSQDFKNCVDLFKKEEFLKAQKCFLNINDIHLKPYKNYYLNLISEIYEFEEISLKANTAVKNLYLLSKTAKYFYSKNLEKAKETLKQIDKKALDEENLIFYYYLKANIFNDYSLKKLLATKYIYNRAYGYKTFLQIYKNLSENDLWQVVDNLISKRMYLRAKEVLPLISISNKKLYYLLYIYVKKNNYEKAKKILSSIDKNSRWYPIALYILIYYSKNWKEKRKLFYALLETKNKKYIHKIASVLSKKAFHYKKLDEFKFYINYVSPSESKVWYEFLYKYFFVSKAKAFDYLKANKGYIKSKNKLNYWLYLSSGKKQYLDLVKTSKKFDFYKIIAGSKDRFKVSYLNDKNLEEKYILIKKLKALDLYNFAYKEAVYLYKKENNLRQIYTVMPEVVVGKLKEKYRFIKPFGNLDPLVYAIMKQESLFYYKAISFSNAVGLMQFIPSTAYWVAKKRNHKNFDITYMFNPKVSIDYGKWYIDYLLKRFNNNVFYAISAYNGGERNVLRTISRFSPKNIAEFIETHPFDETRNYLKKVYTNYVIYKQGN